ncbi:MAG TPA: bacillithiol biosynthesis cysteine-adding enzyme BshC, partial [Bacillales bacterium]|nr:bacillithiol biosynthesis cysteine-adding enzyme BshC [Bacillales bacterium]
MEMTEIKLPQKSQLASDYFAGNRRVLSFFDYDYREDACFEERLEELRDTVFPREALAGVLNAFNKRYDPDEAVLDNIDKIKNPDTVVVVGGQQAGVMTGPLYTIHKCLSILTLARQQQEKLGVPVVPVFWIAGEDHDFEEINHTYVMNRTNIRKVSVPGRAPQKKSASATKINKEELKSWIEEMIRASGETEHTKEILRLLEESLDRSRTYVDWFCHLIMRLFGKSGLVLVDSGDENLRAVESDFFKKIIAENDVLNAKVMKQADRLRHSGYEVTVDVDENSANLFYQLNGQRVLLERDKEGNFRGKGNECLLTESELLDVAEYSPERLSNNV